MLKAAESTYLDPRYPWVKLKKDYIPNLGDCIDLGVLGAGWDIDRARELRGKSGSATAHACASPLTGLVDTSVFTTFYIGVLTNREAVKAKRETPHFEILFRASYGMDRGQLEVYNENIRLGRWRSKPFDKDDPLKRVCPASIRQMKPAVLYTDPGCSVSWAYRGHTTSHEVCHSHRSFSNSRSAPRSWAPGSKNYPFPDTTNCAGRDCKRSSQRTSANGQRVSFTLLTPGSGSSRPLTFI